MNNKTDWKQNDGVTHINIHWFGNTSLGRSLYRGAGTPFVHPKLGPFNHLEGFWFYISRESHSDDYRRLPPKKIRELAKNDRKIIVADFKTLILEAQYCKISQNETLKKELIENQLPFDYYYFFGESSVPIRVSFHDWFIQQILTVRDRIMLNETIDYLDPHTYL